MYVGELAKVGAIDEVEQEWFVIGMTYDREWQTGLNNLPHLISHNGVLIDFGESKQSEVITANMLFNIDIVYLDIVGEETENDEGELLSVLAITDIVKNVSPGNIVTQQTPTRFVFEVNAGEADRLSIGDKFMHVASGYIPLGYMPLS